MCLHYPACLFTPDDLVSYYYYYYQSHHWSSVLQLRPLISCVSYCSRPLHRTLIYCCTDPARHTNALNCEKQQQHQQQKEKNSSSGTQRTTAICSNSSSSNQVKLSFASKPIEVLCLFICKLRCPPDTHFQPHPVIFLFTRSVHSFSPLSVYTRR